MPAVGHGFRKGAAQAEAAGRLLENLGMLSALVDPAFISPSPSASATTPDTSRRFSVAATAPPSLSPSTEHNQSPAEHEQALCKRYNIRRRKGPYIPKLEQSAGTPSRNMRSAGARSRSVHGTRNTTTTTTRRTQRTSWPGSCCPKQMTTQMKAGPGTTNVAHMIWQKMITVDYDMNTF
jgi:hypothetical protein